MENWQSEYLQFFLYIFGTVWLVQRGSPESKELQDVGTESDEEQRIGEHARDDSPRWAAAGGWRTGLFSRSLGIAMGVIFLASWAAMSVAGWSSCNEQQLTGRQDPVGYGEYVNRKPGSQSVFAFGVGELVKAGLRPPPPVRFALSKGTDALQALADGGVLGKVVLEP